QGVVRLSAAGGWWQLRPDADHAGLEDAYPRRLLLGLDRPHRRIEGRRIEGAAMTVTLALPSKGRLKDEALAVLARAGLPVATPQGERRYRAHVEGRDDIEVAFLSASEIPRELGQGSVDLGVTGQDLLRETIRDWQARVA